MGIEDKKPPPFLPITEKTRSASHHDHSREPARESDAIPPAVEDDEISKAHELGLITSDELKRRRGIRPTGERLDRLEAKHDQLDAKVDRIDVAVADMGGQFKVIPRLVDTMEKAIESLHQREHLTFTAKVDVDKAKAMSEVEIETVEKKDEVDAKKAKREWVTKALAIVSSIAAIIATTIAAGRC